MKRKVQLIRPPIDTWYKTGFLTDYLTTPTGLCIIANTIRNEYDVQIIDGFGGQLKDIIDRIDPDSYAVGVSELCSCHMNSLKILEEAKKKGVEITMIGGPGVNHIHENIANNHGFVDFVVAGDGEEVVPLLLSGENHENIPNLTYRKNGVVVSNPRNYVNLTALFDIDDIKYASNRSLLGPPSPVTTSFIRGCLKAEKNKRCSFCSIDNKLKVMDPEFAYHQVKLLNEKYGFTKISESGDTFFVGDFPEKLASYWNRDLPHMSLYRIYASPDQITADTAEIARQLNVGDIFLGLETPNDEILRTAGKSYNSQQIEDALNILDRCGFNFHLPFMYGLTGDTNENAERTLKYAETLTKRFLSMKLLSSLAVPLPGTQLFNNINNNPDARAEYQSEVSKSLGNRQINGLTGDLSKDDIFDYSLLLSLHLKYSNGDRLSLPDAIGYVKKTRSLVENPNLVTSFDINKRPIADYAAEMGIV